jgi:hypothetical protein
MKTIALTLFAAALGFAQSGSPAATSPAATSPAATSTPKAAHAAQDKKPAPASKLPAKPPAKAEGAVQTIPAGAKQVEPNLYRYTDSSGKTWNYRQTPFGISKWEETAASAQPAAQAAPPASPAPTEAKSEPVVVTDLGDSYRFEKKTPFGASTWIRKKSELNENEKALAAQQSQSSTTPASLNAKPAGNQ